MLKINADLHCKEDKIHARSCVVEKVVTLPGAQFDSFSRNLFGRRDFIKDNKGLMRFDADGTAHCLLVVGEGREDGILVQDEGYGYARHSAHVPNVHSILAVDRYPALGELCRKLTEMADHITVGLLQDGNASMHLAGQAKRFDIDMQSGDTLCSAVTDMVAERMRERGFDVEMVEGEISITPRTPVLEQAPEQGQEPMPTMGM